MTVNETKNRSTPAPDQFPFDQLMKSIKNHNKNLKTTIHVVIIKNIHKNYFLLIVFEQSRISSNFISAYF